MTTLPDKAPCQELEYLEVPTDKKDTRDSDTVEDQLVR